eukprot:scaffold2984_cov452-Prasinococcus_capsulatus_cf.AAC.4
MLVPGTGFLVYFDVYQSELRTLQLIEYMKGANLLSSATSTMTVQFVTLNAEYDIFLNMRYDIEFTRPGKINIKHTAAPVPILKLSDPGVLFGVAVQSVLTTLSATLLLARLVFLVRKSRGTPGGLWNVALNFFGSYSGLMETACLLLLLTICILWWVYALAFNIRFEADDKRLPRNTTGLENFQDMVSALTIMSYLFRLYFVLAGILIILSLLWFLSIASVQPRLAVVSQTIQSCAGDILHLVIFMILIHMLYVIILHLTFGYKLPELARFGRATYETFGIILGDTGLWGLLHEEFTGLELWISQFVIFSYPFLLGFVMLNFILAVMGESFAQSSARVSNPLGQFETWCTTNQAAHSRSEQHHNCRMRHVFF